MFQVGDLIEGFEYTSAGDEVKVVGTYDHFKPRIKIDATSVTASCRAPPPIAIISKLLFIPNSAILSNICEHPASVFKFSSTSNSIRYSIFENISLA